MTELEEAIELINDPCSNLSTDEGWAKLCIMNKAARELLEFKKRGVTIEDIDALIEARDKATEGEWEMHPQQTGPFLFCEDYTLAGRFASLHDGFLCAQAANTIQKWGK